ncbi:MAG: endonuclease/exonuclease/phosphatase family protein [Spirochaetota bacterium]
MHSKRRRKNRLGIFILVSIFILGSFSLFVFFYSKSRSSKLLRQLKDEITVASFNIKVFGPSKLSNESVMKYIVEIIKSFDIVAIQEIRSSQKDILQALVNLLGNDWDYRSSNRLGRTSYKEQYGFVFRKNIITVESTFQVLDPTDLLHREPFICYCRSGNFDFSLINIHTDPDEVKEEINYLDDILTQELNKEQDAILLGDFNASPSKFDELALISNLFTVILEKTPTNVRESATYDNIVFLKTNVREYVQGGVFNFKKIYNLDEDFALKISDHYPVYATFRTDLPDDD